jgi:uncharacterized protein YeeX (DUF496 family)
MQLPLRVWFCFFAAVSVPAGLQAQTPDNTTNTTAEGAKVVVPKSAPKPVRKSDQAVTSDSIGLLAVPQAPRIVSAPATGEPTGTTHEVITTEVASEIASLEKQVKDKQKRIVLLLTLFVDDEKEFLKNGVGSEADPVVQERRRYEQDELRWETAELAKVQVRLKSLKSENGK